MAWPTAQAMVARLRRMGGALLLWVARLCSRGETCERTADDSPACSRLPSLLLVAVPSRGTGTCRRTSACRRRSPTGARHRAQTGFAYLGGLRTFAAAVLWNRLEPSVPRVLREALGERLVSSCQRCDSCSCSTRSSCRPTTMPPSILARRDRMADAALIAREGVSEQSRSRDLARELRAAAPDQDKKANLPAMLEPAERAHAAGRTTGPTTDDRFEGYGIFRTVYNLAGRPADGGRDQTGPGRGCARGRRMLAGRTG